MKKLTKNIKENDIFVNAYTTAIALKKEIFIENQLEEPAFCVGNVELFKLYQLPINIFCISEYSNKITIKGYFTSPCEGFEVILKYNDKLIEPLTYNSEIIHFRPNYNGENIFDLKVFEFNFEYEKRGVVQILLKTAIGRTISPMVFYSLFSPFFSSIGNKLKVCENVFIRKLSENVFYIQDKKFDKIQLFTPRSSFFDYFFDNYKKYINRKIWVFTDRFLTADDNGFALYNYAKNIDDGIEKYFIIGDVSKLRKAFPDDDHILDFKNFETSMIAFFAEKWISSIPFTDFYRYNFQYTPMFYAFNNSKFVFLQHGIIKDDVTKIYNGLRYNFSIFVTSTRTEHEFVSSEHFGYPKGVVKMTGLPRFDDRISSVFPKKIITFLPTWHRSLSSRLNITKEEFINSEFGKVITEIVTNKMLINALESTDFRFVIKFHPHMSNYVQYIPNISSNIIIAGNNLSYKEVFDKSCLLITDYSSAVFDFVYAKRPIIYFQKLQHHNESAYFNYQTDGFGDIIYQTNSLIDRILKVIYDKYPPKMSLKYQKRVDKFFTYLDTKNCQRTYSEILKL